MKFAQNSAKKTVLDQRSSANKLHTFSPFLAQKFKKNFNQCLLCKAPKCWSKYTKHTLFVDNYDANYFHSDSKYLQ